ncbi:conjugal transfer protein TraB [Halobacteriales archaeon QS_1_68_17]|nr:MAG: conjugal transfer protein TraB [Halobacteriales archaeon QS_1_68_17]
MTDRAEMPSPAEPSGEGAGEVTVLGTAHVSHDSVEEVERTIEERRPDLVAVELDDGRYRQLKGETPDDLDPSDLLGGNTIYQFLAYWLLSYVQTRLGDRFDITPGADMLAAVETAEELGIGVALVDRDIQTTIQRFWQRLRFREKLQMFGSLLMVMGGPMTVGLTVGYFLGGFAALAAEIVGGPYLLPAGVGTGVGVPLLGAVVALLVTLIDGLLIATVVATFVGVPLAVLLGRVDVEEDEELDPGDLTDADVVTAMMEEFRRFSPGGAEALIDERDAFIAHRLVALREQGYDVVAVVGAGHREGIERYLADPASLPPMESLVGEQSGGRFSLYKAFGYLFTLGFLVFFLLLAMAVATGVPGASSGFLLRLFGAWFLINGVIAAALAKIAGARWPSATVGGAVAWLTSVNPLLAPGWFAGYVELRYTTVNVADISKLNDILSDEEAPIGELLARLRAVPLFRLIVIVAFTNIGSFVASMLFGFVLLPYFSGEVGGVDGIARLMIQGAENSASLIWRAIT